MAIFKGEMSFTEILNTPKKLLLAVRDARVKRLINEKESQEKQQQELEKQIGRNNNGVY